MISATTPPPAPANLPAESIAAMVRALPAHAQPSIVFRDAACAILRMNRTRGRVECDALGLVFEDEDIPDDRRILILDLLACAGTPEAQVVMRRLLALGVARRNSRTFATYVQRLGFVEQPDIATVRFLFSVYAESRYEAIEIRSACAYALGAAAGRANAAGLKEAAQFVSEMLRRDLGIALEGPEKCALLSALGNVGLEADVPIIIHLANDSDPRVRGAAALALRKMHTAQARAALLMLLVGANVSVAESALSALFGQTLEEGEIVRLAELVLDGRTALALDGRILRLIVTQKVGAGPQQQQKGGEMVERVIHVLLSRIEAAAAADEPSASAFAFAEPPHQVIPPPASKSGKFPRVQAQALSSGTELSDLATKAGSPAAMTRLNPEKPATMKSEPDQAAPPPPMGDVIVKRNSTLLKTVFEPQIAMRMNAVANSSAPPPPPPQVVITEKAPASAPLVQKKFASTILQGGSDGHSAFRATPPGTASDALRQIQPAPIVVVEDSPPAADQQQTHVLPKRQPLAQTMVQREDIKSKVACSINVPIVELALRRIRRSAP